MTIEKALKNAETAITELRQALINEEILVSSPEDEESLVTNQSEEAREEYWARRSLEVRL